MLAPISPSPTTMPQTVAEICARLDGLPLAIELAAARVRALSLAEILESLHDRFRLLTGGARTAVRRQQTLRASVDWSHALLTEPERVLVSSAGRVPGWLRPRRRPNRRRRWRRAALPSARSAQPAGGQVAGGGRRQRGAEPATGCWRPCANTRWKNSASPARPTLCARATVTTTRRWRRCSTPRQALIMSSVIEQADTRDRQPARRVRVEPRKLRYRAGVDAGVVAAAAVASAGPPPGRAGLVRHRPDRPRRAPAWGGARGAGAGAGRQGHPRPLGGAPPRARIRLSKPWRSRARSRTRHCWSGRSPRAAMSPPTSTQRRPARIWPRRSAWPGSWATGGGSARSSSRKSSRRLAARDPIAARAAAEEGRDLADAIGDRFDSRRCRWYLGVAQVNRGDLAGAVAQFAAVADEAEAAHDEIWRVDSLVGLGIALAYQGDTAAARAAADAAVEATAELGGLKAGAAYHVLA